MNITKGNKQAVGRVIQSSAKFEKIYFQELSVKKKNLITFAKLYIISMFVTWHLKNIVGHTRRRKKNEPTLLYSVLIKRKFVCEVNSFAFNGNSLRWEHDCIFALPLRLSVNHYYKQVISAQSQ